MPAYTQAGIAVAWGAFAIWTIRRLWRSQKSEYSRLVYEFGVRKLGIWGWLGMTLVAPLLFEQDTIHYFELAAFIALFSLPLALWAGYFWGKAFAKVLGLREDHR